MKPFDIQIEPEHLTLDWRCTNCEQDISVVVKRTEDPNGVWEFSCPRCHEEYLVNPDPEADYTHICHPPKL